MAGAISSFRGGVVVVVASVCAVVVGCVCRVSMARIGREGHPAGNPLTPRVKRIAAAAVVA